MQTKQASDRIDVVIVGGGQAGLAVSHYLQAFGVEHVVLERGRVAESWRSQRWDSFTLVTPNWMTRLPGHAMTPGSGRDFLPLRDVVDMLERFGRGLPVRTGVGVTSVTPADRGYQVVTTAGDIAARVVADLPLAKGEVHVLLDGLLIIEIDGKPVLEAGPGAIFDPGGRTRESKEHVSVRARTRCRLAVLPRYQLDSQALLGVAAQQTGRLRDHFGG